MIGHVRHRRFSPVTHRLNYPIFMPLINLDELEQLAEQVFWFGFRPWHWARFRRRDYLGEGNLKQAVIKMVNQLTGENLEATESRVMALLNLRYLGIYFSPVNFYYIYDQTQTWSFLLAEVSNTPWNERHYYALDVRQKGNGICLSHAKAFHVSPFNPIRQKYQWRLWPTGELLRLHLACLEQNDAVDGALRVFDASLVMKSLPFTGKHLLRLLLKTPVMAVKILWGIYSHAFRLWRKGAPVYSHPDKQTPG
jgi:DUF1365 family protein